MEFISERTAFTMVSETVVKAGVSLFNAVKYIYMIADKDFYNINIKDIFKIALNNISDTTCLYNTGIKLDKERCAEMNTPEYERVLSLMVYSFAVRLPTLKNVKTDGGYLNDKQIKTIYDMVISKGAGNYDNVIADDFEEIRRMVKAGRNVPAYDAHHIRLTAYRFNLRIFKASPPQKMAVPERLPVRLDHCGDLFADYYQTYQRSKHYHERNKPRRRKVFQQIRQPDTRSDTRSSYRNIISFIDTMCFYPDIFSHVPTPFYI
mgnify:CR=1 FL=1